MKFTSATGNVPEHRCETIFSIGKLVYMRKFASVTSDVSEHLCGTIMSIPEMFNSGRPVYMILNLVLESLICELANFPVYTLVFYWNKTHCFHWLELYLLRFFHKNDAIQRICERDINHTVCWQTPLMKKTLKANPYLIQCSIKIQCIMMLYILYINVGNFFFYLLSNHIFMFS